VMAAAFCKLLAEAMALRHLRGDRHTVMKRVALVMTRDLHGYTLARFVFGGVGGIVIPGLTLMVLPVSLAGGGFSVGLRVAAMVALSLLVAGELLERYLFFKAAPASRMPGGLA